MGQSCELYSEKLVQRVNELYYDLIGEQYDYAHSEIFIQEKERWEGIANQFFNFERPTTILDIGTGTGFVPLVTARFLKKEDTFICSDVSKGVLKIAKKNVERQKFRCKFKFIKVASCVPFSLPFKTKSVDAVTINSVLHHIKDTNSFLKEVNRILKSGGLFFIAHEPNKYFFENRFLWYNYLILSFNPKSVVAAVGRKTRTIDILQRIYHFIHPANKIIKQMDKKEAEICQKINVALFREKLLDRPLTVGEVGKITDIKGKEGFKFDLLFPNFKPVHVETYNHLFQVVMGHHGNQLIRIYDNLLRKIFPKYGASFFAVLKKP